MVMSEQKPPKRIYLQEYFNYSDDMVTWCQDKINEDDIEYILQSEYNQLRSENDIYNIAISEIYAATFHSGDADWIKIIQDIAGKALNEVAK